MNNLDCLGFYHSSVMASGFKNIVGASFVIVLAMMSCLPDPIEMPDISEPPKIVVSSQIVQGTVNILLTRSISALDASDDSDWKDVLLEAVIKDAIVTITYKGEKFPLKYASGVYSTFNMAIIPEESYELNVYSPTYGTVKATTIAKRRVNLATVRVDMTVNRNDTLANVSYSFKDPQGANWYLLSGQHVTGKDLKETMLNPRVTIKPIEDSNFAGEITQGAFSILFDEVKPYDTVSVILANVTQEYYNYIKVREDTQFGVAAALGEPVNFPSNVEGGLGFFNLYLPDVRTIILRP